MRAIESSGLNLVAMLCCCSEEEGGSQGTRDILAFMVGLTHITCYPSIFMRLLKKKCRFFIAIDNISLIYEHETLYFTM